MKGVRLLMRCWERNKAAILDNYAGSIHVPVNQLHLNKIKNMSQITIAYPFIQSSFIRKSSSILLLEATQGRPGLKRRNALEISLQIKLSLQSVVAVFTCPFPSHIKTNTWRPINPKFWRQFQHWKTLNSQSFLRLREKRRWLEWKICMMPPSSGFYVFLVQYYSLKIVNRFVRIIIRT